ncbi:MAG: GrpB family protein [Sphingopyxis sp.]|nr:GrpB family protein [Sphingopyxis sp.]
MAIQIIPYNPAWPDEFQRIGNRLRAALGDMALRINHIGSTSVSNLAAKDIIDVQISVAALDPKAAAALAEIGVQRIFHIDHDHAPPTFTGADAEWSKWIFKPPASHRPANIHMRVEGRANQRYALLFRDYLRAQPLAAQAYAQVKLALARRHADDVEFYYDVKDPVCDIIMAGAEEWARYTGWTLPPTDA